MSNAQAREEVAFLSEMERQPPSHETRITVDGRDVYKGDGMMWELLLKIRNALGMVSKADADRGPRDYPERSYERGYRDGARSGGYYETPKNTNGGNSSWQKWMMTLCGTLAVVGIGGVVGMYGKLSAVEANQASQQKQLDNLTQMLVNLTRRNP